jgi:hypothetical protein
VSGVGNPITTMATATASGGGGGGWFGGGGGGAAVTTMVGPEDISGSGGGGAGSGFGPAGVAYEAGVNAGEGSVLITYAVPEVDPEDTVPPVVAGRPSFTG